MKEDLIVDKSFAFAVKIVRLSKKLAKLQISYKEARKTKYWLRLMTVSEIINKTEADCLIVDCDELIRIIVTILKSSKR